MTEYVDCRECNTECARADGNYGYTFCSCFTPKKEPMTNADRIRAMSDEEMAAFLIEFKDCGCGCLVGKGIKDCSGLCATENTLKIWLQQPAEDDDHE